MDYLYDLGKDIFFLGTSVESSRKRRTKPAIAASKGSSKTPGEGVNDFESIL